ncbi:DUF7224 domain-containing protein [Agromyces archimandritae]|uniref:Uncharacterized protein n=1 Tax=Agromyces archimandritae TaxID=2781962 RepID=A0A975IRA1_9MICO|nr:hypothetical protein [Agromyces archimandritae]QTX05871.1 hypothetical protein G127AT_06670 [Agromyces archimandritae]
MPVPFRRRAVLWLVPPALVLLFVVNNASQTGTPLTGYWTWTVAHSVLLLIVPAAVAATGAALEGARLRTRAIENRTNLRNPLAVLWDAIWTNYTAALIVQAFAIGLVAADAWGGRSRMPWELLIAIAAMLLFHSSAGLLLGSLLRPMLGVPIALAFSYAWLGFTGTVPWFAPRHLAGLVLETCCFYDQQPDPRSVLAASVFAILASAGFVAGAARALHLIPGGWMPRIAAPALLTAAVVVGLAIAAGLTSTAATERTDAELRCTPGRTEVCLYPEQAAAGLGSDPTADIQQMVDHVMALGVTMPDRVVAGSVDGSVSTATAGELHLRYLPGMTVEQLAGSLASGFQGELALTCAAESVERTITRQEAADTARSWLALQFAMAIRDTGPGFEPQGPVATLVQASAAEQADWVGAALASMQACNAEPPTLP